MAFTKEIDKKRLKHIKVGTTTTHEFRSFFHDVTSFSRYPRVFPHFYITDQLFLIQNTAKKFWIELLDADQEWEKQPTHPKIQTSQNYSSSP